jgi:hypothetical protein
MPPLQYLLSGSLAEARVHLAIGVVLVARLPEPINEKSLKSVFSFKLFIVAQPPKVRAF